MQSFLRNIPFHSIISILAIVIVVISLPFTIKRMQRKKRMTQQLLSSENSLILDISFATFTSKRSGQLNLPTAPFVIIKRKNRDDWFITMNDSNVHIVTRVASFKLPEIGAQFTLSKTSAISTSGRLITNANIDFERLQLSVNDRTYSWNEKGLWLSDEQLFTTKFRSDVDGFLLSGSQPVPEDVELTYCVALLAGTGIFPRRTPVIGPQIG